MFPLLAEIRAFSFGHTPRGWAACNGQLMTISENAALFSILGTQYGGDGLTNFMLPDLRGRVPVSAGHGLGLSAYAPGDSFGAETVTLTVLEMAAHSHAPLAKTPSDAPTGIHSAPQAGDYLSSFNATATEAGDAWSSMVPGTPVTMHQDFVGDTGNGDGHENRQPFLVFNYCIALQGIFPYPN